MISSMAMVLRHGSMAQNIKATMIWEGKAAGENTPGKMAAVMMEIGSIIK